MVCVRVTAGGHRILTDTKHEACLRVQVPHVDCRLLITVLSMLSNEVGTHASRDAASGRRHGDCLAQPPVSCCGLTCQALANGSVHMWLVKAFAAMFAHCALIVQGLFGRCQTVTT